MNDIRPYVYEREPATPRDRDIAKDDFGYFLEHDPELQIAYAACIEAAGIEWTDEEVAECTFRALYGDKVDDLMQYWRQQQALRDPSNPEHQRAVAVHLAVQKWKHRQQIRQQIRVAV